jgi:ATP-dependent DNA helicase RecG
LNNCIAHQDYLKQGKINVVENEGNDLVFSNLGSFIPKTIESIIESTSPPEYYRNKFLAEAMVNYNMIDTVGSGIRTMFISQKNKFFPLPEYDLTDERVKVQIIGKVLDMQYAKKLAQISNLDLKIIMTLDKVQKRKKLTKAENALLRFGKLIEGRYPNVFISSKIADKTGDRVSYIRNRAFDKIYYQDMIVKFIDKYKKATRKEIDGLLLNKLPDVLSEN